MCRDNKITPRKGFYFDQENIEHAKRNINKFDWALKSFNKMKNEADLFLKITENEIYEAILPMKDQTFAYGKSGCPNCNKPFFSSFWKGTNLNSKNISSLFDKKIKCFNCGMTFPNDDFPDNGQGFVRNDKAYYLIGMYNSIIGDFLLGGLRNQHEGLVTKLVYLYMITGEKKYARRALIILDAFSAIIEDTIGPRDFTDFGSDFIIGRLHLLTSIVHRVKIYLAHDYDWLYYFEDLDKMSIGLQKINKNGSFRDNIEKMLNDYMLDEDGGPEYNLQGGNLTGLHNHEADGVRSMQAVGLVLENENYCKWGIEAVKAFIYNTIGRDSIYFEGSMEYSLFTASVFMDMALLSKKASKEFSIKDLQAFSSKRLYRFAVKNPLESLCQGHLPAYGDCNPDIRTYSTPDNEVLERVYRSALFFNSHSSSHNIKKDASKIMEAIYPLINKNLGNIGIDLFYPHIEKTGNKFSEAKGNRVFGQAGIGILRSDNQELIIKVGQNNIHSHDDVLSYNLYKFGKEITADIGYTTYGSIGHFAWGAKTIAHNNVVVNKDENLEKGQIYKAFSGGDISLFQQSENIKAFEGRAPNLYNIDKYQRFIALFNDRDGLDYLVDFFYVADVNQSDYSYHAFHEESSLELSGAKKVDNANWTLGGINQREKPYFDYPGKSLGERLKTGGSLSPLIEGEKGFSWTPDPNNGYGFIYNLQEFTPVQGVIQAQWLSEEGYELNWRGIVSPEDRIFKGYFPDVEGINRHSKLLVSSIEREKLYAAVVDVQKEKNTSKIKKIEVISSNSEKGKAICVISDRYFDYWFYSPNNEELEISTFHSLWNVKGRIAWIRTDKAGAFLDGELLIGEKMSYGGKSFSNKKGIIKEVTGVNLNENKITVTTDKLNINKEKSFMNSIKIKNKSLGTDSLYLIDSIKKSGNELEIILEDELILSAGVVEKCEDRKLYSYYPLPLAIDANELSKKFDRSSFVDKTIIGEKGGKAIITGMSSLKTINIELISPFQIGENFLIADLKVGDYIELI